MRIKSIQKLENVDCSWNRNVKRKKIETEDDGIKLGILSFLHSRNIYHNKYFFIDTVYAIITESSHSFYIKDRQCRRILIVIFKLSCFPRLNFCLPNSFHLPYPRSDLSSSIHTSILLEDKDVLKHFSCKAFL